MTQDDQERRTTDIDEWDQKYMEVDQETLFDIIMASILTKGKRVSKLYHRLPTTLISNPF